MVCYVDNKTSTSELINEKQVCNMYKVDVTECFYTTEAKLSCILFIEFI